MADGGQDGDSTTDPRASTDSQSRLLLPLLSPPSSPLLSPERRNTDVDTDIAMAAEERDRDRDRDSSGHGPVLLLRRIDARIMPLLFATSMFTFMDKAILSSAAVFGLRRDTALTGAEYAWVSGAFYVGYLVATYPATRLVARLPVARYLGANTLVWGAVVALTAACGGFKGLFVARFFLGVAEASVSPALVFVTATWYTRDEIPARTGVWFAGNSVGGIVSSLLAFGLGSAVQHGAWRWMFALLGILTFILGAVLLVFLPNSISCARFLTPEERRRARDRVVVAGLGDTETNKAWRWDQMREALVDPKTWMIWSLALLCQIPNGGTQNFANIVITSFGFSALQSTLINIPYSVLSITAIAGSGWLAGRFRSMNCILIALVVIPPIVGSALISHRASIPHGVSLFGYFLLSSGPSALPLLLSLVQSNFRGVTKKMTMTALLFIAYCAGNIAGPQLFIGDEAPTYNTAFRGILVCYSLVVGFSLALRTYLQAVNRQRQKREGVEGSAGASGAVGGGKVVDVGPDRSAGEAVEEVRLRPEDYEDVTDWNTFGFRYRL
ncbi:major facilitator superfamily domain-containing protein [Nemania abortiva]|nr:major facilitator superfamily domain-containing protein [Nemania abortiva]